LAGLSVEDRTARWTTILAGETAYRSREYVGELNGQVVGFGSCGPQRDPELERDGFTGEIAALYVLNRAHRLSVGTALMAAMAEHLHLQGCQGYGLWVLSENVLARAFYERCGGSLVSRRVDVRDFGSLQEVAYGWRLSARA
jgi:ribosomal protein S18 acetylase RimI-like enzyme